MMENDVGQAFENGWQQGSRSGESERIALATANSDLRSRVHELEVQNRELWATIQSQVSLETLIEATEGLSPELTARN